jgi:hypothetical protein
MIRTRTPAAPAAAAPEPPEREMPPRPASGGRWRFDEAAWAYVPAADAPAPAAAAAPDAPPAPDAPVKEF